jgi:hypothetical protein
VVEGVISSGSDSTIFKVSRTVNVYSKVSVNPVLNATLAIEGNKGGGFTLSSLGNGKYGTDGGNLDNTQKYRLRIKTADNKEYLSDYVPVVDSPPIDTVSYSVQTNGIQTNVSTHDPRNSTRYYRWDYLETWVFHVKYYSFYKSNGDTVLDRNLPDDQIYQCWRNDTSSTVVLGSSAALSNDVISGAPVTFVPSTSEKLFGGQSIIISQFAPTTSAYSILVRQYALTGGAYQFWTNLKKSTEQLGSVFDTQPSQLQSNIHSVSDPSENVIGYVSAGKVTSKRIFIANEKIPFAWLPNNLYSDCVYDSLYFRARPQGSAIFVNQEDEYFNYHKDTKYYGLQIPIAVLINKVNGKVIGHTGTSRECADCTLRGTNKQPAFWR